MLRLMLKERPDCLITHFKLLEKVLDAGADPNVHISGHQKASWTTPWCSFLAFLDDLATNVSTTIGDGAGTIPDKPNVNHDYLFTSTSNATIFSPHIQTALEQLLRSGAELELDTEAGQNCEYPDCYVHKRTGSARRLDARIDPLVILRKWLPTDEGSRWPALIEHYLQPDKRLELHEARTKVSARLRSE